MMDLTEDGRRLKMMPVVDEYTRECLSIEVERSITAEDVVATLASLFGQQGRAGLHPLGQRPRVRRQSRQALAGGLRGQDPLHRAGIPWENAYSETFISRFSDELLKREVFADLLEAKVLVEDYRDHYNHQRPHSALGYRTPAEFAVAADLGGRRRMRGRQRS